MEYYSHIRSGLQFLRRQWAASITAFLVIGLTLSLATSVRAQLVDDPSLPIQERRDLTLNWLDRYLTDSELMRKSDMDKIRAAVAQMSPSQLEQWLAQTKDLREYVASDRWQETKKWLRGFLRVQAMYTDAEIQKLRDDLVKADSQEMLNILKRIQAKHDQLVWAHEASEMSRQIAVFNRDETVAIQDAAAAAARASRSSSVPAAGSGQGSVAQSPRNKSGYSTPGALINSRDMARAEVWAQVWGPTWYIGGF